MKNIMLDTDIIIDFLRNGVDNSNIFRDIKNNNVKSYASSITTFELYNGVLLSRNPKEKLEDLDRLLESIDIISFDRTQSYVASKIYVYLIKKGMPLEIRDILISASAISKNLLLLTKNKNHFDRIPELRLM